MDAAKEPQTRYTPETPNSTSGDSRCENIAALHAMQQLYLRSNLLQHFGEAAGWLGIGLAWGRCPWQLNKVITILEPHGGEKYVTKTQTQPI